MRAFMQKVFRHINFSIVLVLCFCSLIQASTWATKAAAEAQVNVVGVGLVHTHVLVRAHRDVHRIVMADHRDVRVVTAAESRSTGSSHA